MQAGKLDRVIDIVRAVISKNDLNEDIETWQPVVSKCWASATPVSDGERFRAGETLAQRKIRFVIRHSVDVSTVDPRDRIIFEGKTFDINGVKEIGRREAIEITATARAELR